MNGLTIGDVAKQAQVRIETLRYYERTGLVTVVAHLRCLARAPL
jgi:hypothetical protein